MERTGVCVRGRSAELNVLFCSHATHETQFDHTRRYTPHPIECRAAVNCTGTLPLPQPGSELSSTQGWRRMVCLNVGEGDRFGLVRHRPGWSISVLSDRCHPSAEPAQRAPAGLGRWHAA